MKQTLSSRQGAILASLLLFANKILVLPSLLYENSKADGFFILIILLGVELCLLALFFNIKTAHPNLSFYDVIKKYLGIVGAKIFYSLLLIYFFFKIMLLFNISYMYFHVQVYIDVAYYLFLFAFLVVMNSSVLRGIRPIGRGAEFFYFFIIGCMIFIVALSIANFERFPLFFDSSPVKFFEGIFRNIFCFGDMLVLFVLMDKIECKKKDIKKFFKYALLSVCILLAIYFMFYSVFGQTAFIHKNAISDIITFSYRFVDLGRLDIIAIVTVMFLSFLQLSIYAYAFSECFIKLFSKLSVIYSVVVFDAIFIAVVVSSVINYLAVLNLGSNVMCYLAIILHLVLPMLIAFMAWLGNRKGGAA